MRKKIRLLLIHLADMFDFYVLHNTIGYLDYSDTIHDFHMRICEKICNSEWWGDHTCTCFHCKRSGYSNF